MANIISNASLDKEDPRFRIKPYQQMTAACSGALLTSLVMTPMDVVKVRIQTQQKVMLSNKCYLYCNGLMDHLCPCGPKTTTAAKTIYYKGTIDAFIKISRMEGVSSLWSGLSPTLVLAVPCTVLYFVCYEQMRVRMKDFYTNYTGLSNQPMWIPLVAGAAARTIAVTFFNPLELVRTKMQSEKISFLETRKGLSEVVQIQGMKGLWRGLGPTLVRDVPFSGKLLMNFGNVWERSETPNTWYNGIYWMNYETIKKYFGNEDPNSNTFSFNFFAGAVSGSVAAVFTLPFDVVKTFQQIEFGEKELYSKDPKAYRVKSISEMIVNIYKNGGIKGLFAGIVPRVCKVAPACALMISTFEYGKSFFQDYNMKMFISQKVEND